MVKRPRFIAQEVGFAAAVKNDTLYRVRISLSLHESLEVLGGFTLDYCCMPQDRTAVGGTRYFNAYAKGSVVDSMRKSGRRIEVLADAEAEGAKMIKMFAPKRRDRFNGGKSGPKGVGILI